MQPLADFAIICADFIGGWEIVLILAVVLILYGARHLPDLGRGLRRGFRVFGTATRTLRDELDEEASDAGRSLGGIYGNPAHEALTPDNETAELYDPAVLRDKEPDKRPQKIKLFRWRYLWQRIRYFLAHLVRHKST
jgi:sec-independent protein translocase protein TatA